MFLPPRRRELQADVDCSNDLVCAGGYCRRPCNSGVDCGVSESCRGGVCVPAVTSDSGRSDHATDGATYDTADASTSDAAMRDTRLHDTAAGDVIVVDAALRDANVRDTAIQDAAVPDASVPDASPGDLRRPDTVCVRSCGSRQCGPDGCGGSCGECDHPLACSPSGFCECDNDQRGSSCCEVGETCVGEYCCPDANWRTTFEGKNLFGAAIDADGDIYVVGNGDGSAYVARLDACGLLEDERSFRPSWAVTASAGNVSVTEDVLYVTGPGLTITSDFTLATDPPDAMLAVLDAATLNDTVTPFQLQDLDEERILDIELDRTGMVWMAGVSGVTPGAVANRLALLVLSDGVSWASDHNPWGTIDDRAYARNVIYYPNNQRMYLVGDWHEAGGVHRGRVSYYQTATAEPPDPNIPAPTLLAEVLPVDAASFALTDSLQRGGRIYIAAMEYEPAYPDGRATLARVDMADGAVLHAQTKFNPTDLLDSPFCIADVPYRNMVFTAGVVDWDERLEDQFENSSAFLSRYNADSLAQEFALTYSRFISFQAVEVDPGYGLIVVALGGGTSIVSSTVMRCDTDGVCP